MDVVVFAGFLAKPKQTETAGYVLSCWFNWYFRVDVSVVSGFGLF
jgi:hypothetical protein